MIDRRSTDHELRCTDTNRTKQENETRTLLHESATTAGDLEGRAACSYCLIRSSRRQVSTRCSTSTYAPCLKFDLQARRASRIYNSWDCCGMNCLLSLRLRHQSSRVARADAWLDVKVRLHYFAMKYTSVFQQNRGLPWEVWPGPLPACPVCVRRKQARGGGVGTTASTQVWFCLNKSYRAVCTHSLLRLDSEHPGEIWTDWNR
jgi:hypothetical protein